MLVTVTESNGMALGRAIEIWKSNGLSVSQEQAFLWLDNYCRQKPLEVVVTCLVAFANERTEGHYAKTVGNR